MNSDVNLPIGTDITSLAQAIAAGTYSEEEQGLALRTVQTNLAVQLISSLAQCQKTIQQYTRLCDKISAQFTEQLEIQLDNGSLSFDDLHAYYDDVIVKQLTLFEKQKALALSNTKLFPEDMMSPDERKLLGLLKSFSTQEQKKKFLQAVQKALEDDNDFTSDSNDETPIE